MGRRLVRGAGGRGLRPHALRGTAGKRVAPPVAPGTCPDFDGFGFGFEVLDGDSVLEAGPVDVGLLDVVVLLELVGLVDVVVLLELVVVLEVDDSDVVDGAVVVVGTGCRPHRCAAGSRPSWSPPGHPHEGGPDRDREGATGQLTEPAMFCMGSGLPFESLYMPTEAASCGVNPANQTDLCSVVVPVLPAAGRPSAARRCAGAAGDDVGHRVGGVGGHVLVEGDLVCLLGLVVDRAVGAGDLLDEVRRRPACPGPRSSRRRWPCR